MLYLAAILLTVLLFSGFIVVTGVEQKRGVRYFEGERAELDRTVRRAAFVFEHVDFASFLRHFVVSSAETIAHEGAHLTLLGVRFLERELTSAVKNLRGRRAVPAEAVSAPASPFVATIATFKHRLRTERKENQAAAEAIANAEPELPTEPTE
jgi:hypothetical protein